MAGTGMNPGQWRRLEILRREKDPTQASIPIPPVMAIQGWDEGGAAVLPRAAIASDCV